MKILLSCWIILTLCYGVYSVVEANDFRLQFLQHVLNSTNEKVNLVVAPQEAYELYSDLFEPNVVDNYQYWQEDTTTPAPALKEQEGLIARNVSKSVENVLYSIYMKSRWAFNFQTRDTHKHQFHQFGMTDHRPSVDFLRKDHIFNYGEMDDFNASVLVMPLHYDEMKFVTIVPNENTSLNELKDYLSENVELIAELGKKSLPLTLVRVLLPKFRVSYKQDLKAFYDEISSEDIDKYASIHQVSNVEVNERGIGEFERTTVLFWNAYSYLRVAPKVVDINRPFLFMITNKEGIQFFGQVVKI